MTAMRVVVHIGHYKCGTTALQRRLTRNRSALADQGVDYPDLAAFGGGFRDLPNHSALAFELLRSRGLQTPQWYENRRAHHSNPADLETLSNRLREMVTAADGDRVLILSSEELMRFAQGRRAAGLVDEFCDLLGDADITAFAHLRRPDGQLPSWYNQMIKLGASPENLSSDIDRSLGTLQVDYAGALRPWVERLGSDRVVARRYEFRRGDITDDFLDAVGLDVTLPAGTERWENERLPDVFIETLRRWNHVKGPPELTQRLKDTMVELGRSPELAEVRVDVLDEKARARLHAAFVDVDRELTELLQLDESLFPDIDEILERPAGALTDLEAHAEYGGLLLTTAFSGRPVVAPDSPPVPRRVAEPSLRTRLAGIGATRVRRVRRLLGR